MEDWRIIPVVVKQPVVKEEGGPVEPPCPPLSWAMFDSCLADSDYYDFDDGVEDDTDIFAPGLGALRADGNT